jgi:ArsR family transcriptional regulator
MKALAQTFKALSDETRLLCVALLLLEKELCVCELENALNASQSKTSRHLRYLLNAGLVSDKREGTWVYYQISNKIGPEQRTILDVVLGAKRRESVKSALKRLHDFRKSDTCPTP